MKLTKILCSFAAGMIVGGSVYAADSGLFSEAACNPCDEVACSSKSPFEFGGWVQAGQYFNSHGFHNGVNTQGPGHTFTNREDLVLNQLYLHGEKTLQTKHGFDIGGRVDLFYGTDAWITTDFGDNKFDAKWGNQSGYGLSVAQAYTSIGYKDLTVKIGKFYTPLGWEAIMAENEFFYSHNFMYYAEPSTHTGFIADYKVNDRLTLTGSWNTGLSNSVENANDDYAGIWGFTYVLTDKATVYYYGLAGRSHYSDANPGTHWNYFKQSLVLEYKPSDRWTFITQWDLNNDTDVVVPGVRSHSAAYGVQQHAIFKLTDVWSVGSRIEWWKDDVFSWGYPNQEFLGLTLGVNYNKKNLSIRPEIRYDSALGHRNAPYGNGRGDQVSGGACALYKF